MLEMFERVKQDVLEAHKRSLDVHIENSILVLNLTLLHVDVCLPFKGKFNIRVLDLAYANNLLSFIAWFEIQLIIMIPNDADVLVTI